MNSLLTVNILFPGAVSLPFAKGFFRPRRPRLTLLLLPEPYAICRLHREDEVPAWALSGDLVSITRTPDELSVVCSERSVPATVPREGGWRVLKVEGPLSLDLVGVLASLTVPLAQARIPVAAIATYETDYLLIREDELERAAQALSRAGHHVSLQN